MSDSNHILITQAEAIFLLEKGLRVFFRISPSAHKSEVFLCDNPPNFRYQTLGGINLITLPPNWSYFRLLPKHKAVSREEAERLRSEGKKVFYGKYMIVYEPQEVNWDKPLPDYWHYFEEETP